jgi:hypothetical protein
VVAARPARRGSHPGGAGAGPGGGRLTDADLRGLSALFWGHLNLYGRFDLDMTSFLDLDIGEPAA